MAARLRIKSSKGLVGISRTVKKALGLNPTKAQKAGQQKTPRRKSVHPNREEQFRRLFEMLAPEDIARPVREHRFATERKWRFDFAWPDQQVAVEIHGGLFQRTRVQLEDGTFEKRATGHRSIGGLVKDLEKSNAAVKAGWGVLTYHAKDLDKRPKQVIDEVVDLLRIKQSEHFSRNDGSADATAG